MRDCREAKTDEFRGCEMAYSLSGNLLRAVTEITRSDSSLPKSFQISKFSSHSYDHNKI